MTLDEITKAASDRLAALDAKAKPHEAALVAINAERDRLRSVIAASGRAVQREVWINPAPVPFTPFPVYPPVFEPWYPAPQRYTDIIITTTASNGIRLS